MHPLPGHIESLLEIALHCPTVCPDALGRYILSKVTAEPVPSARAAMAWLHFAHVQNKQVLIDVPTALQSVCDDGHLGLKSCRSVRLLA